ncbi:MAG: hypothetical protein U0166_22535 [Acidobacteriota bacterium]
MSELNADELKSYLYLAAKAEPRKWIELPDPPQFVGKPGDTSDPSADQKRFKAAYGGLKLKDLVELNGDGRFRMPYLSIGGTHVGERVLPTLRERAETWQELQKDVLAVVKAPRRRESFVQLLDIFARYQPRFDETIATLTKENAEKSGAMFDDAVSDEEARAAEKMRVILSGGGPSDAASARALAKDLIGEHGLPADLVWEEVSARLAALPPPAPPEPPPPPPPPPPSGPPPMTMEELETKWGDFVKRVFPAYVGRPTKMGFLRLMQMGFLFAANTLPEGEPEELFGSLRDLSGAKYQELLDKYLERARDVVETDAAKSVPDQDLADGKAWEHAKRLAAKHEVPVEVAMDVLSVRAESARKMIAATDGEFVADKFEAPDISGLTKEEGELAWIDALAPTSAHREHFRSVLKRLRRAKKGYLERAITAYCGSIMELLEEHGMLENPTDEILDNIVATINEQTAYFREQYFALTVDPVEPDDVRHVLGKLATERQAKRR